MTKNSVGDNMETLPLHEMPECWNDDIRMNSLYAPFRLQSLNPVDWESKMNFWFDMVSKWCAENKKPVFSAIELKAAFKRKNKSPNCLDTVIENMIKTKQVCPMDQYQNSNDGWVLWGTKQLLRPVTWASKSLLSKFVSSEPLNKGLVIVVHLESLKKQAILLITNTSEDHRIGNISEFVKREDYPDEVFSLLVKWLLSQNLITFSSDGQIYKLSENINTKVSPLTENEICLLKISQISKKLQSIVDELEKKIETAKNSAKVHIQKKNKSLAMNQLKYKKSYEIQIDKVLNKCNSLFELSETIKQTNVDSEIFAIFQNSLATLKKTTKEKGLEEITVINTMDDVKQALDDIAEIQSVLAQPIGTQFDDIELETELENLNLNTDLGNNNGGINKPETDNKSPEEFFENTEIKKMQEEVDKIGGLKNKTLLLDST